MALVYHRVDDPVRHGFLTCGGTPVIRPESLAAELIWLRDHGARFLTFRDLCDGVFPDDTEFGVIVTFDDGFRDEYTTGIEVLDALGVKGVFFQCTAMIDGDHLIPEHALYWLVYESNFAEELFQIARSSNWPGAHGAGAESAQATVHRWLREVASSSMLDVVEQMAECYPSQEIAASLYPRTADIRRASAGGHEIGSHGHYHLHRQSLDARGFERELATSSEHIRAVTGTRPATFAYPFSACLPGDRDTCGRYFPQAAIVGEALIEPDSDPLRLPRFTWPGPARNRLRQRRWLLTGTI